MKQRKHKNELSDKEFIRLNKKYNEFIKVKNKRDNLLCNVLIGLLNYKINTEKALNKLNETTVYGKNTVELSAIEIKSYKNLFNT